MLQAVVKMYTVYWPLTIGTIILLIVLFVPGGVLGLVEKQIKARQGRLGDAGGAPAGPEGELSWRRYSRSPGCTSILAASM